MGIAKVGEIHDDSKAVGIAVQWGVGVAEDNVTADMGDCFVMSGQGC